MASSASSVYEDMINGVRVLGKSESAIAHVSVTSQLKTPAAAVREALSVIEVPSFLYQGIPIMKVTSTGVLQHRILTLSSDHLALFITHRKVKASGQQIVAGFASSLPIPLWTPRKGFRFTNDVTLRQRYIRHLDVGDIDVLVEGVTHSQELESVKVPNRRGEIVLTLFHHGMSDALNLLIKNPEHRGAVVSVLGEMKLKYHQVIPYVSTTSLLLRYVWYHIDQDRSGNISRKEFKHICDMVNLQVNAQEYFDKAKHEGKLTYNECVKLLVEIRNDVSPVSESWTALFGDAIQGMISPHRILTDFLHEIQGETYTTIQDAQRLVTCISRFGVDSKLPLKSFSLPPPEAPVVITKDQFQEFLFSEVNSAFHPNAQALPDRRYWDQPISKYWINTSHNTYLLGDQLQSKSSVDAYIKSLYRGCRCVELDCWDGNNKDLQAVVFHGHTLTSRIFFVDILLAVDAYLKANQDSLPIILSIENHCSHPYQLTMAQQMKNVLGDRLYVPPIQQDNPNTHLPSPNQLRGMVVVKGKRTPEVDEGATSGCDRTVYDEANKDEANKKGNENSSTIVQELAFLTLFHGTKFKSFDRGCSMPSSHMHSIGESKVTKILNQGLASDWREYNRFHMTRTYPAGFRVDSSNYNPTIAWAMGCQLVALNFQTPDTSLLLNDGRFRQAGGSGYVLKPDSVLGLRKPRPLSVKVSILAGNCLPKPKGVKAGEVIDPYVRVELHDVADKGGKEEYVGELWSSPTVANNGFCPTWRQASRVFYVQNPDVAMFMFQVLDNDVVLNEAIASCAIPVSCLRTGTRSVPLYEGHHSNSRSGVFGFATLLIRVDLMNVDYD